MKYTLLQKQNNKNSIVESGLLDLKTAAYYPHYDFLYQKIKGGNLKILDFGCGKGIFSWLLTSKIKSVYAYDIDKQKIARAKKKFQDVHFIWGRPDSRLPFPDSFFDAVVASHVFEHVENEEQTVKEIARVLKPKGVLYLVSPYKGILTFLDSGNIRYRFPKLHKQLYSLFFEKEEYKKNFQDSQQYGLYGDCSIKRRWHHHYTQEEIEKLLKSKFRIIKWGKFSLFCPILLIAKGVWEKFFKHSNSLLDRFILADHGIKAGNLSYTFYIEARKIK